MKLYAAIARRRLSQLQPAHHAALRQQSDQWMIDQRIKNPDCFVRMFAPGFPSGSMAS
jgi:hypothetical protein